MSETTTKKVIRVIDGVLRLGAGGSESSSECMNVRDKTLSLKKTEADVTHKGGGDFELTAVTLTQVELSFKMLGLEGDRDLSLIQNAFISNSLVSAQCLDRTGGFGISSGDFIVADCSPSGDIKGVTEYNVVLKPTIGRQVVISGGL